MNDQEFKLHAELEDTHWWFRARREIIVERFLNILPKGRDRHVVEIGCGTGGNLKELGKYYRVTGVDMSPEAVRFASEKIDSPVVLGNFRDVLRDYWQDIDGVLLADVLEHVENDRCFVEDLLAGLKPGAVIVITVPAFQFLWSSHDQALGHVRRYRQDDFRALWRGLPVKEDMISYFNSLLFPAIAIARLLMNDSAEKGKEESSLKPVNPVLNTLLLWVFRMEKRILHWMRFPFGVSLIAVLRKN